MDRVVSRELEDGVVGFLNHDGVYYKWMESDVLKLMRLDSPNHMLNLYESLKIDHMFVRWRALEPGQPPVPYHSDHTCVIEFEDRSYV